MKTKYLLVGLGLLAGCGESPEKEAESVVHTFYKEMHHAPSKYDPLELKQVSAPAKASAAVAGERWFYHRYVFTDSLGRSILSQDTVAVEPDGRVLFWSSK
jgi:hypothetical protein